MSSSVVLSFRWRLVVAGIAVAVLGALVALPGSVGRALADADPPPVVYRPPLDPGDGEIIDHFRPPPGPYAPGNRGLDYATVALSPVRASADGVVVFAGQVGATLHVTLHHDDGLRTSYSFLADVLVHVGDRVHAGDAIGATAETFHFGVRTAAGEYLDPESLFGRAEHVRLVPGGDDGTTDDAPAVPATERGDGDRASFDQLVRRAPGGAIDRVRLWMHNAREVRAETHLARVARGLSTWLADRDDCTPADQPVTPIAARRILVEVGGLGSTSEGAAVSRVDTGALGYPPGDVVRFSYRGGRVPPPDDHTPDRALENIPATRYAAADSQGDLVDAAARLDDLLRRISVQAPGVPIDIVAHSQGGIVARLALERAGTDAPLPPEVATLVTLGSPHEGADLAAVVASLEPTHAGEVVLDGVGRATGVELDPRSPAAAELVATSPVLRRVAATPMPASVRVTSIGARGDVVVPANRTVIRGGGAHNTIVPLTGLHAHDELPGSAAATREIGLAIAGLPPTCRTLSAVTADLVLSEQLSLLESSAAVPAGVVAAAPGALPPLVPARP